MPEATENDGSCQYPATTYTPEQLFDLPAPLPESSELFYACGLVWSFNDSGNEPRLIAFQETGNQIIRNVWVLHPNIDWEAAATDSDFLYLGDIGNNVGNRQNLIIHKIALSDLCTSDTVIGQPIRIAYGTQTDFSGQNSQHNYDAEALAHMNDSLHVFSKNRANSLTYHYVIPKDTGTYIVFPRDSLVVEGMITSANAYKDSLIILVGYGGTLYTPFAFLLWDFQPSKPFSGNKRRFTLGTVLQMGQLEAVLLNGFGAGWMSNERVPEIGKSASFYRFDLSPYLSPLVSIQPTSANTGKELVQGLELDKGIIWLNLPESGSWNLLVRDLNGREVLRNRELVSDLLHKVQVSLPGGFYSIEARFKKFRLRGFVQLP
jgi:hypothetical protein